MQLMDFKHVVFNEQMQNQKNKWLEWTLLVIIVKLLGL
jgi:hypothetical protein